MAFSRRTIALLSLISLYLFLFVSLQPTSILASKARVLPSNSEKVSLGLYYESLCPYSANFIVNYLVKIFEDDLLSIVDLKLFPWGNAKIRGNSTVVCQLGYRNLQRLVVSPLLLCFSMTILSFHFIAKNSYGAHGPYECLLNTVEACAIDAWPELNKHFPFIYCIEALVQERKYLQWETCYEKLGLDPKHVNECYKSEAGKELELQYGAETDALQPPHRYVPWVVVDGQPLYEDYENFLSYICKAYKGPAVPTSCSELSLRNFDVEGAKPGHFVSYKDQGERASLMGKNKISHGIMDEPDEYGGPGIGTKSSGSVSVVSCHSYLAMC
ncbi:hypothetical protein F8388_011659 [Cannabis sativa]|uniref:Gamma-interferon-inducible lysosomal thiol reductase n=1 Tax=Cannabis sativa TaxID=3483 RepID=A0A7J6GXJ9_CANSA|nr:hypothetical protein F8388_011659 [Cannabis sativa]